MAPKLPPENATLAELLAYDPQPLWDSAFAVYALEIGYLLRAWNDLQEKLADLFGTIVSPLDGDLSRSIWYAVPSDRLQRAMLLAAAAHKFGGDTQDDAIILGEIKWALKRATALGPQRDAAAHAPLAMLLQEPVEFIARHLHGNPLATALKGKKLLTEFRLYRERAVVLHDYAREIDDYIRRVRYGQERWTWPKRPAWPNSRPSQEEKSRTSRSKEPSPQRRVPPGAGRDRRKT